MRLWQGEQIDGSILQWGVDERGELIQPREIQAFPTAVMSGWRYSTSLKSTARYLRAPMHVRLENKSWREAGSFINPVAVGIVNDCYFF